MHPPLQNPIRLNRRHAAQGRRVVALFVYGLFGAIAAAAANLAWKPLFNDKNLDGWVDVNTSPETWSFEDGILKCTGKPIGVIRTEKQYENFIMEIDWMHLEAGGNSGVFVWSNGTSHKSRLPIGIEVQMLELAWPKIHNRDEAYVSGELFASFDSLETIPDNPRGTRSKSVEMRCKGKGEWNTYLIVCVDGVVKLSINGKFVNGLTVKDRKKGYICLEAEGAPINFRNARIIELPSGITNDSEIAPLVE